MTDQQLIKAASDLLPNEAITRILAKQDEARLLGKQKDDLDKKVQSAWSEFSRVMKEAVGLGGVQIGKVYVVQWGDVPKAVRIIRDSDRSRSGRSDDHEHLKLEVMDMA